MTTRCYAAGTHIFPLCTSLWGDENTLVGQPVHEAGQQGQLEDLKQTKAGPGSDIIKLPKLAGDEAPELSAFGDHCAAGVRQAVEMIQSLEHQLWLERSQRQRAEADNKVLLSAIHAEEGLAARAILDMAATLERETRPPSAPQKQELRLSANELPAASEAATAIQKHFRGHTARKDFQERLYEVLRGIDPALDPTNRPESNVQGQLHSPSHQLPKQMVASPTYTTSHSPRATSHNNASTTYSASPNTSPSQQHMQSPQPMARQHFVGPPPPPPPQQQQQDMVLLPSPGASVHSQRVADLRAEVGKIEQDLHQQPHQQQGPQGSQTLDMLGLDASKILQGPAPAGAAICIAALVRRCKELQAALAAALYQLAESRKAEEGLRQQNAGIMELSQVRLALEQERADNANLRLAVAQLRHKYGDRSPVGQKQLTSQSPLLVDDPHAQIEQWEDLQASAPSSTRLAPQTTS